jgi:starch synthase
MPDVVHANDWPTGLVPVYLNTTERHRPLGKAASVFTIHNLQHQGYAPTEILDFAGLPRHLLKSDSVESLGGVNMLKAGLYHSTKLTTVSKRYAQEIQCPEYAFGLANVTRFRAADLVGIANGIDVESWNPRTDPMIPANYSAGDLVGKAKCKVALQERMGLNVDPNIPIFAVVSRLYHQKGVDWLADILPGVLDEMQIQFILLGSGEPEIQRRFEGIAQYYPGRMSVYIGYDNELAHWVEAGSDFFVMPSRFEPCGLNQMYSMAYGTVPIVRATGGLSDTVDPYVEGETDGTGFLFQEPSAHALYNTLGWACSTYYDRPEEFRALQVNGMRKDFSWQRSAGVYEEVYRWAIEQRSGAF